MSGIRLISACWVMVCLCVATTVNAAGQYLEMRFERSEYRAQGGVDIVLDPSTPANGALGGGLKARILNIDIYTTLSEGRRAYKLGYDIWQADFPGRLDSDDDLAQLQRDIEDLTNRVKGDNFLLELHTRIDLLNFMINKGPWTVQLGGYAEFLSGAHLEVPQKLELIEVPDTYIDIGTSQRLMRAGGRGDAGFSLGVGYAIPFADKNVQWSLGGRIRGFYRFSMPEHAVTANAHIYDETDIHYPKDVDFLHGWGVGLDFYTTLHFSEDLTGFRVGAYVEDLIKVVSPGDGTGFFVPPRLGVGFAWISPDGKLTVGTDLERVETFKPKWKPTWQTGIAYRLGNEKLYVAPKAGFIFNHRNIVNAHLSPAVTGGLEINLAAVKIVGAIEYHTATRAVNAAASLGVGF